MQNYLIQLRKHVFVFQILFGSGLKLTHSQLSLVQLSRALSSPVNLIRLSEIYVSLWPSYYFGPWAAVFSIPAEGFYAAGRPDDDGTK